MADNFDLVVLGGGMGGYVAAIRATQLGMTVGLVEKAKLGGTCLHIGCIPTKALLHTAEVYHLATSSSAAGVKAGAVSLDWAAANTRKQKIVDQLHKGVQYLMKKNGVEVIEGAGAFASAAELAVKTGAGERRVTATNFIIAT